MHLVVRKYDDASQLFDLLEQRAADVREVIQRIPGVRFYFLARTETGGVTLTVCDDEAGADESVRLAADWIRQNAQGIQSSPPDVTAGEVKIVLVGGAPSAEGAPLSESSGEPVVE